MEEKARALLMGNVLRIGVQQMQLSLLELPLLALPYLSRARRV